MLWILGIILFLLLVLIIAGEIFLHMMIKPKVMSKDHEFDFLPTFGFDFKPFYLSIPKEPFTFQSSRGYTLQGEILPAAPDVSFPDGRQRAILLAHGYTANRYTMLSYAEIFHRLGFHVAIYDQPFHGESEGPFCSMGYYEHMDCAELANFLRERFPKDTVWGIMGESMGAATIMMAAPKLPWLSFVIEDCGYATMREECRASLGYKMNLPGEPLTFISSILLRFHYHFSADWVKPIESVPHIPQPMLFIHGGVDRFVPTECVHRLFSAKKGPKELHIFEDVPHAKSSLMHHEECLDLIRDFLQKYAFL